MKKLLLFVALTASISFCTSTLNSFASSNNSTVNADAPAYWQGWATDTGVGSVYITVYQTSGQCNAYYAIVTKIRMGNNTAEDVNSEEVVVHNTRWNGKYYVRFRNYDFYFNM